MARLDRGLSKQRLYVNPIYYRSPIEMVQVAVGHNTNTGASGPFTVTATLPNTPSATSTLVAVCSGVLFTAFAGSTLAWALDQWSGSGDDTTCSIFHVPSDGVTTAFTFTGTGGGGFSSDMWLWIVEVSGLSAAPLDFTTFGVANSTTWSPTLSKNRAANELEIYAVATWTDGSTVATNPLWTNGVETTFVGNTGTASTVPSSLFVGTKITNQVETPSTTVSWTTSALWGAVAASYHGNLPVVRPPLVLGQAVKLAATM